MKTYTAEDIALAQAGDEPAFERLLLAHYGIIWQCYRKLSYRLNNDEWLQECRIIMLFCIRHLAGKEVYYFSGYFKRACVNKVMAYFGREFPKRNQQEHELFEDFTELIDYQGPRVNVAKRLEAKAYLMDLINKMAKREQEIMRLKLQGYSNKEIASQLGLCRATIQNSWRNLKENLQNNQKLL